MIAYGLTILDPTITSANGVRIDNAFTVVAAGTRYLTLAGNATLFVKGGAAGGSISIAPTRDTIGKASTQGEFDTPTLSCAVTNGQIKRCPVERGLYMDSRGIVTITVTGDVSLLVSRRTVKGQ